MSHFPSFIAAAFLLLLTPGPTNSLVAAGGALDGWRRAWPLLVAELLGYACGIAVLELLVAPFAEAFHPVRFMLQAACALYLAVAAWQIWKSALTQARAVTFRRVFLATLSNPKAAVFVFVILPPRSIGFVALLFPYLTALMALIAIAGSAWMMLGSLVHGNLSERGDLWIRRAGSLALGTFSSLLVMSMAGVW